MKNVFSAQLDVFFLLIKNSPSFGLQLQESNLPPLLPSPNPQIIFPPPPLLTVFCQIDILTSDFLLTWFAFIVIFNVSSGGRVLTELSLLYYNYLAG